MQFARRVVICADKTVITLSILNSNEHSHAAQLTRVPLRSFLAGWLRRIGMLI